jgi:hypothetical protein
MEVLYHTWPYRPSQRLAAAYFQGRGTPALKGRYVDLKPG